MQRGAVERQFEHDIEPRVFEHRQQHGGAGEQDQRLPLQPAAVDGRSAHDVGAVASQRTGASCPARGTRRRSRRPARERRYGHSSGRARYGTGSRATPALRARGQANQVEAGVAGKSPATPHHHRHVGLHIGRDRIRNAVQEQIVLAPAIRHGRKRRASRYRNAAPASSGKAIVFASMLSV